MRQILGKNQSSRSEPQNIRFTFYAMTTKLPSQGRCYERNIVELVNCRRISLVAACAADCCCHHLTNLRKKLKFPSEVSNSKQIGEFKSRKYCWTWCFKGFFRSWAKNYRYVVICHSDGHITIRPILEKTKVAGANHKTFSSHSML